MKTRLLFILIILWIFAIQYAGAQTTWTGASSTSWNVAGNWSAGIPNATTDAIIPNKTNQPVVNVTANCKSLSITGATNLTLSSNLTVAGTLTISNGASVTIPNGGSTIYTFSILGASTINGGNTFKIGTSNIVSFKAITMTYGSVINNAGECDITGNITSSGITFQNTGIFNISSTAWATNNSDVITNTSGTMSIYGTSDVDCSNGITITNTGTFNIGKSGSPAILNLGNYSSLLNNKSGGTVNLASTSAITFRFVSGGTFNTANGTITNAGTFNILSDANGSGIIGTHGNGNSPNSLFTGTYNVQTYISGNTTDNIYRGYRLLSCPVNKSQAYASASASSPNVVDISYLGSTGGAFTGGPGTTGFTAHTANPLIYLYSESIKPVNATQSFTSGQNVGVNSIGTNVVSTISSVTGTSVTSPVNVKIPAGNGYLMYYIGPNTSTATTRPNAASCVMTATGYVNQGTIILYLWGATNTSSITYTSASTNPFPGYTMVGNPYPATLDLSLLYNDNSTYILPSFTELNDLTQGYVTYNASSGSSGTGNSQYVASGQGFFINVRPAYTSLNPGKLTFYETDKALVTSTAIYPSTPFLSQHLKPGSASGIHADAIASDTEAGLHLKLAQSATAYDECGIFFKSGWSDDFDDNDSFDMDGVAPKVYLSSYSADNKRTSVNALDNYTKGKRIKLYVRANTDGLYTLQMEDFVNIDTSLYNVYLIDKQKGDSLDMVRYNTYSFNLSAADTAAFHTRFELAIEQRPLPQYQLLNFTGQKVTTGVQLNWATNNAGNYTGFILEKQGAGNTFNPIYAIQSSNTSNYSFVDQSPVTGNNIYRLEQNDINGNITYSAPVTIGYNNVSSNGLFSIYPNPANGIINITLSSSSTNLSSYTADIYNTSGVLIEHKVLNSSTWTEDISGYKEGMYIMELKNNNGDVLGKSKFLKTK